MQVDASQESDVDRLKKLSSLSQALLSRKLVESELYKEENEQLIADCGSLERRGMK